MLGSRNTISFQEAVDTTYWLLETVGEQRWIGHFAKHRCGAPDGNGFRSVYAGMGSFTDVIICRENKHNVDADHEPLANELLDTLSSICYATSHQGDLSPQDALDSCRGIGRQLQGWRCRDCGYGQISTQGILAFAAHLDVQQAIKEGAASQSLLKSIQSLWGRLDTNENVSKFRQAVEQSGLTILDITGWMRPCPECGSDDTCVYRWTFDGRNFTPSSDNLSMNG